MHSNIYYFTFIQNGINCTCFLLLLLLTVQQYIHFFIKLASKRPSKKKRNRKRIIIIITFTYNNKRRQLNWMYLVHVYAYIISHCLLFFTYYLFCIIGHVYLYDYIMHIKRMFEHTTNTHFITLFYMGPYQINIVSCTFFCFFTRSLFSYPFSVIFVQKAYFERMLYFYGPVFYSNFI